MLAANPRVCGAEWVCDEATVNRSRGNPAFFSSRRATSSTMGAHTPQLSTVTSTAGGPVVVDGQKTDGIDAVLNGNHGLRALDGKGELALEKVRKARAKLSPRLVQHQFSYYTEINLLSALGRTKEARVVLDARGPIPTGEVLKLSYWIAELHLYCTEGAVPPGKVEESELYDRMRKGLSMTAGRDLLLLPGWWWVISAAGSSSPSRLSRPVTTPCGFLPPEPLPHWTSRSPGAAVGEVWSTE